MNPADIVQLRKDMGLSQADFARLFDAHFMTVSKWERGVSSPSAYQQGLMHQFRMAANTKKEQIQEQLQNLLIGAGVIAALFWLLSVAAKK
jgi:transcriptional regulator with XRE-family HTH domain